MATLTPDFDSFARAYESGQNQVVYARLAADLDTPVSLMLKLTSAAPDAFVLESGHGRRGAGALFDHRHEARRDLAVPRHRQPHQPRRAV